jgi:hypothetical protein
MCVTPGGEQSRVRSCGVRADRGDRGREDKPNPWTDAAATSSCRCVWYRVVCGVAPRRGPRRSRLARRGTTTGLIGEIYSTLFIDIQIAYIYIYYFKLNLYINIYTYIFHTRYINHHTVARRAADTRQIPVIANSNTYIPARRPRRGGRHTTHETS